MMEDLFVKSFHEGSPSSGEHLSDHHVRNKTTAVNAAAQRRRKLSYIVGKERREALVRSKRLRTDQKCNNDDSTDVVEGGMDIAESNEDLEERTRRAVEELKSAVFEKKPAKKLVTLRNLRKLLSCNSLPPIDVAVKAGVVPLLVDCLQLGSSDEQLVEAVWSVTNIASGEPQHTRAVTPAIPLLIAHVVDARKSPAVVEQCAWAIGNFAGDSADLRETLLHQGALLLMYHLMISSCTSVAKTASWAMSNLIKGPHPSAAIELMKLKNTANVLIRYVATGDEELATEAAWVLVYLTSMSKQNADTLVESGLFPPLVTRLATSHNVILLTPILRTIGNILAGDTENSKTHCLLAAGQILTGGFVQTVSQFLESEHRSLQKEAGWVVSNIAAGSVTHKEAVFTGGALSPLLQLLATGAFDVRKEAAFTIANMCVQPGGEPILRHLTVLIDRGCLPGFIALVKSPDSEAARLGLQFLDLVMKWLPNDQGPKLVEKEDGIEAIESQQNSNNDDLRELANKLIDTYFGENYGLEEEYGPGIMEVLQGDQGVDYPPWRKRVST